MKVALQLDIGYHVSWIQLILVVSWLQLDIGFYVICLQLDIGYHVSWLLLKYWISCQLITVGYWISCQFITVGYWISCQLITSISPSIPLCPPPQLPAHKSSHRSSSHNLRPLFPSLDILIYCISRVLEIYRRVCKYLYSIWGSRNRNYFHFIKFFREKPKYTRSTVHHMKYLNGQSERAEHIRNFSQFCCAVY
jgi:hypothetical protein